MIIVVDASVAVKWFIAEDNANDALELLGKKDELHAPDLLFLDIDGVLCKLIRRGLLSEDEGFDIHNKILSFPIRSYPSQNFREEAFHLAIETKSSVYDCLYLALAEALDGRMITADGRSETRLKVLISGKLYILDQLSAWPVHNPEINTETIITMVGFFGAILLLLDVVVIR